MSVIKLDKYLNSFFKLKLQDADTELYNSIRDEFTRQQNHIELIASENIVSKAVLEAQGSVLTNKYAEGLPNKRYYGGCEFVDQAEELAIQRACKLFSCKWANVQPNSGSGSAKEKTLIHRILKRNLVIKILEPSFVIDKFFAAEQVWGEKDAGGDQGGEVSCQGWSLHNSTERDER